MVRQGSRFDVVGQLPALRRYARVLTRDDAETEELLQDALVRAYERRSSFDSGRSLRGWLLSILHNRFIDRIRTRKAERHRLEKAAIGAESTFAPPQEHVVRLAEVREAFLELPEEQRSALHLVAIEGLAYQEAADALSIPLGTLMSRVGRARASLRAVEDGSRKVPKLKIVGGRTDDGA